MSCQSGGGNFQDKHDCLMRDNFEPETCASRCSNRELTITAFENTCPGSFSMNDGSDDLDRKEVCNVLPVSLNAAKIPA
ncbi:MAG: hypothetical protein OXD44_03425 [Gammaproteobacteria bacterium]|nr:hypothetical protein [Gammaproteobacteria bacterium]